MGGGNMYNFAIIDDNLEDQLKLKNKLQKYCISHNSKMVCDTFFSPDLFDLKSCYDAVFLDIVMPEHNGIDFARKLNHSYETKIIFVTNHKNYMHTSFDVHPFHYICKDNFDRECQHVFKQLFQLLNKQKSFIVASINNSKQNIPIQSIYYIEIDDHLCTIHLEKDKDFIQLRQPIKCLYQQLINYHFIQINRATLINMKYISHIVNNTITLKNNISLSFTHKYKKEFYTLYKSYILDSI